MEFDQRLRLRQGALGAGFVPGTAECHGLDGQVGARQSLRIPLALRSATPASAAGGQGVGVLRGPVIVQSPGELIPIEPIHLLVAGHGDRGQTGQLLRICLEIRQEDERLQRLIRLTILLGRCPAFQHGLAMRPIAVDLSGLDQKDTQLHASEGIRLQAEGFGQIRAGVLTAAPLGKPVAAIAIPLAFRGVPPNGLVQRHREFAGGGGEEGGRFGGIGLHGEENFA